MAFDFDALVSKKKNDPSWHLMLADNAPLIISFLDLVFRERNQRQIEEPEMVMHLDDFLYELREGIEENPFPRTAKEYLEEWTAASKGWLRKFYPNDSNIPHYDLTPATEKVMQWIDGLFLYNFIGTESRMNTCFDLLRQIVQGSETDKDTRIAELKERKLEIEKEISQIEAGEIKIMNQRQIRERFLQFRRTAKELLGDFRAVEHHFRELDREIREEIAGWEGEKGDLLIQFFGEHDSITQSEEGQSFQAFWDFIMSPNSQEKLSEQLDKVFKLEELGDLGDDTRLRRIHFDWVDAGEQTQRTVARLSKQLRRYLDDKAFWESRRIIEILDSIEKKAVKVKNTQPSGTWMQISDSQLSLSIPMEQPLFTPSEENQLISTIKESNREEIDTQKLFNLVYVDTQRLQQNIDNALSKETQVRLAVLLEKFPLQQGLSELITYLQIAENNEAAIINEQEKDSTNWIDELGILREAIFPRIIYCRRGKHGTK
ncbi:DUF3375 domain-containing protein [uncultured Sphaerochaeta sp.]|uniref:DUF3375 domain-containing protein n=1 Tax=uncultured Sphaerochaeta sp. TaxID=886478 RepID=UPI003749301B